MTGLLPLYAMTLALSAFLLFVVQPLFTRMVLPHLGGAPAVWGTCVMWFQATLLAGYLYAHVVSRALAIPAQIGLHLAVLAATCALLPLGLAPGWTPPEAGTPIPWLVGLLTVSIGAPFFGVCTTAPLLQRWFSWTRHPTAADPYHLYSASNIGGLLALFSYPIGVEPLLGLRDQAWAWTGAYGLLVVLVGLCGLAMLRNHAPEKRETTRALLGDVSWSARFRWTAFSFVPSSLLLGVTLHITTDVAAVPFLWVAPLGLYILSFVLVFARRPALRHRWMVALQPWLLVILAFMWHSSRDVVMQLGLHLAVLFVTAMVCHGELARHRPEPRHLTEFYLWISAGGLLGSLFTVLLAPVLFDAVLEYPLMLVLACLLRPAPEGHRARIRWLDLALPAGFALLYVLPRLSGWRLEGAGLLAVYGLLGLALYLLRGRPLPFALSLAVMLFVAPRTDDSSRVLLQERTFFGLYRVKAVDAGHIHLLYHGSTIHGAQARHRPHRLQPYVYFHRAGPLGQLFGALERAGAPVRDVGVAGLGIGTIASYLAPAERVTFFEIDPAMEDIARDTRFFTYLDDFGQNVEVVLGDARLSLARQADGRFDLLILDAFTSDAVPVHLMTREALGLYLQKLAAHGLLVFNISNRHVRLGPVLATLAADAGLTARLQAFVPGPREIASGAYASTWVVMARRHEDLAMLGDDPRWRPLSSPDRSMLWTDDYANLFRVLAWLTRLRQRLPFT